MGWMWGGCGMHVGWMWGGCRVDVELLSSFCVKSVEHKGQKRKLLLAEDGTVYKVKRSKNGEQCRGWAICLNTVYLYYIFKK